MYLPLTGRSRLEWLELASQVNSSQKLFRYMRVPKTGSTSLRPQLMTCMKRNPNVAYHEHSGGCRPVTACNGSEYTAKDVVFGVIREPCARFESLYAHLRFRHGVLPANWTMINFIRYMLTLRHQGLPRKDRGNADTFTSALMNRRRRPSSDPFATINLGPHRVVLLPQVLFVPMRALHVCFAADPALLVQRMNTAFASANVPCKMAGKPRIMSISKRSTYVESMHLNHSLTHDQCLVVRREIYPEDTALFQLKCGGLGVYTSPVVAVEVPAHPQRSRPLGVGTGAGADMGTGGDTRSSQRLEPAGPAASEEHGPAGHRRHRSLRRTNAGLAPAVPGTWSEVRSPWLESRAQ